MKPPRPPRPGQRRWKRIPEDLANLIRNEHWSATYGELAKKYNLSLSVVWNLRVTKKKKQQNRKKN